MNKIKELIQGLKVASADKKRPLWVTFILPVVCLIVTIGLLFSVVVPQSMDYLKINSEINNTKLQIDTLDQKATVLEGFSGEETKDQLELVLAALPAEKDYIASTSQLQNLAQQSGATLTGISFSDSGAADSYQIKVEVTGSYDAINNFIHKINSAPRVMKVATVELSPERTAAFLGTISILAYTSPLITQISKVDQPVVTLSEDEIKLISQLREAFGTLPGVIAPSSTTTGGKTDPFN